MKKASTTEKTKTADKAVVETKKASAKPAEVKEADKPLPPVTKPDNITEEAVAAETPATTSDDDIRPDESITAWKKRTGQK